MQAILQSNFEKTSVDRDARIVHGCRLLEVDRSVTYKGKDGQPKSFFTTASLADGLIRHAGNRSIPAHLTHDWTDGKKDALHARLGTFKNLRKDETGNLIGDLHCMPNEAGDTALWLAENDPENAAFSAVFDYNPVKDGDRTIAVPLSFQSADLVARGAAATAMLSETQPPNEMNKEEIQALVTESITAALAAFKPEPVALPGNLATKEDLKAALADFKPSISEETKKEFAILAKAAATEGIGNNRFLADFSQTVEAGDKFTAKLSEYRKTAPNEATAIARVLKDHPELSEARENVARLSK